MTDEELAQELAVEFRMDRTLSVLKWETTYKVMKDGPKEWAEEDKEYQKEIRGVELKELFERLLENIRQAQSMENK